MNLAPTIPFIYTAYGTLIHNYLDGQITDNSKWVVPLATLRDQLKLLHNSVGRKYDTARREYLRTEGGKNAPSLSGHVMRKLMELSVDERRELSEQGLKVIEETINACRESLGVAFEQGIASDAIRFDSHNRIQSVNLEVASAMSEAALKAAEQNIQRYVSELALFETEYADQRAKLQQATQQITIAIEKLQAQVVSAQMKAVVNELASTTYELQAILAKKATLVYELEVLRAEVVKNEAEVELARAEQLVAEIREVTASYEETKAAARMGLASTEIQKTTARVARAKAQTAREEANASIDVAEVNLSVKEKELGLLQDRFEVTKAQNEAAWALIRKEIPEARLEVEKLRASINRIMSEVQTSTILSVAQTRATTLVAVEQGIANSIVAAKSATMGAAKAQLIEASNASAQAIIDAAKNASDATVETTLNHYLKSY